MKKILSTVTAFSMLASVFSTPAFAALEISGNGAKSYNKIKVKQFSLGVTAQKNVSFVNVVAGSSANTGGNEVKNNTGGDSSVDTGKAKATTTVIVEGSVNKINESEGCGCPSDPEALISGNGYMSYNKIVVSDVNVDLTLQKNVSVVGVLAGASADSGDNTVKNNTGGSSDATTGNSTATTLVSVEAPVNVVNP